MERKPQSPTSFKILNWAVATHLSKTGNFMFPLLLIETACITSLLHNVLTHSTPHTKLQKISHIFYIKVTLPFYVQTTFH